MSDFKSLIVGCYKMMGLKLTSNAPELLCLSRVFGFKSRAYSALEETWMIPYWVGYLISSTLFYWDNVLWGIMKESIDWQSFYFEGSLHYKARFPKKFLSLKRQDGWTYQQFSDKGCRKRLENDYVPSMMFSYSSISLPLSNTSKSNTF